MEIANTMTIPITFILESAKAHNGLQVTRIIQKPLSPNNNVGGNQTTQHEQGTASQNLHCTGCQAKPTFVQTSVYNHRVHLVKGTRSHTTEASTASLQPPLTMDKNKT